MPAAHRLSERTALIALVVVHLLVALIHGYAHQRVPVPLTPVKTAFVGLVVAALPLIGAVFVVTRWRSSGALVVSAALLASAIFGLIHHYILISPDNIFCVPESPLRGLFVGTAHALLVSEFVGSAMAFRLGWNWRHDTPRRSRIPEP